MIRIRFRMGADILKGCPLCLDDLATAVRLGPHGCPNEKLRLAHDVPLEVFDLSEPPETAAKWILETILRSARELLHATTEAMLREAHRPDWISPELAEALAEECAGCHRPRGNHRPRTFECPDASTTGRFSSLESSLN